MSEASKIVSSAILGIDGVTVVVAGNAYYIPPPTILRIAGAACHLSAFDGMKSVSDALHTMRDLTEVAKALSYFIIGDESLADELCHGTMQEVISALEGAMSLIDVGNFSRLSVWTRSVSSLTAKPRQ